MISIQDLLLPDEDPLAHHHRHHYHEGTEEKRHPERVLDPTVAERTTTHFQVEFILDTICPHCYIGLKNLTAAMQIHQERHPEDTFEVTFSPVMLSRGTSRSAYDKDAFYHSFGWPPSQLGQWSDLGAAAGVAFSWRGRTGNSRDSHKLLRFALEDTPSTMRSTAFTRQRNQKQKREQRQSAQPRPHPQPQLQGRGPDLQLRLAHALLRGYFEEDRDVSDRGFLAEVGAAVTGYPAAAIRRACLLDEDEEEEEGGDEGNSKNNHNRHPDQAYDKQHSNHHHEDESNGGRKKTKTRMRMNEGNGGGGGGAMDMAQQEPVKSEKGDDGDDRGSGNGNSNGNGNGNGNGGDPWGRAVDALEADVRARGIDAVPTIIVQDRYLAGGWQEAPLLVELFERIRNAGGGGGGETAAASPASTLSSSSSSSTSSPSGCWLDGCGRPCQ